MRFALANGNRAEASPGLTGTCPGCGSDVVAKCGTTRVWHWAHRGFRFCDPWWEPETEWHRGWKAHFPAEQQEVRHQADDGEWHIADVRTTHGLVLEFQHSHLDPAEREARDSFYDNLIWIVDGRRLKRTSKHFFREIHRAQRWRLPEFYTFPGEVDGFPQEWIDCRHPVIFDFMGPDGAAQGEHQEKLWCLLPGRAKGHTVVISLSSREFLQAALTRERPIAISYYLQLISNSVEKIMAQRPTRRAIF